MTTATVADVNRCLLVAMPGHTPPPQTLDWLREGLAGVILFAHNIAHRDQLAELTAALRGAGDDVLVALDEEGGDVTRLHAVDGSPNPGNLALGAVDDVTLTARVAAGIGAELRDVGINLNLAPDADVNTDPNNPIIGTRSFGDSPQRVAAHVTAYLAGMRAAGVAGCAKHFPGHGDTTVDSHLALPTVTGPLEPHLVPFRAAIAAGVPAILTAHVVYPAVDDVPATLSHSLLTGMLRDRLGFTGTVITDSMTMAAIANGVGMAEGAVRALAAGADLICMNSPYQEQLAVRDHILAAVRSGRLDPARVIEAAGRVRALARGTGPAAAAATPVRPADDAELSAAARAALRTHGNLGPLPDAPFVLELTAPRRGIEETAGSLLALLSARDDRVTGTRLTGAGLTSDTDLGEALADADGKPLVVVVRDARRQPEQRAALATVLAKRPDAVVVGIGTDADRALAPDAFLGTRGGARVNLTAAADLLRPA